MKPKVSIRLMTYNHEPYIRQAMDSIMMQKVDFDVEVIVGDDFSTDGTLNIIKSYKSTDKISIRVLERKKGDDYWIKRQERGRLYNFENIIDNCHGKYTALLDGDDYWYDPYKLKLQVEYLEKHKETALVYTGNFIYNEKNGRISKNSSIEDKPMNFQQLLRDTNRIPTPTVMGKTDVIKKAISYLNENIKIHKIMDYPLWLAISNEFDIAYIPIMTAVYRFQENTASRPETLEKKYDYLKNIFDIRQQFINVLGLGEKIERDIEVSYIRKKLYYAFCHMDKNMSAEAIQEIKKINGILSFQDRMKYIGTINKLFNKILKLVIK